MRNAINSFQPFNNTLLMENMENHFIYTSAQFDLITHVLTLGVGAQLGGLLYFLLTRKNSAPRYQLSSVLSIVVMISAALILLNQQINWTSSFKWDGNMWQRGDSTFSNGYRYVNWSIDVPVLLTQLLVVLGITGAKFKRIWLGFTLGGLAMIYTGYIGQYYETTSISKLLIWGGISSVFMVYICYLVGNTIFRSAHTLPGTTGSLMRKIFWLLIFSWTLYPIAYLVPWFMPTEWGMVLRQTLYTVADITSKVIYGIMLSRVADERSAHEGYLPALQSLGWDDESRQIQEKQAQHPEFQKI